MAYDDWGEEFREVWKEIPGIPFFRDFERDHAEELFERGFTHHADDEFYNSEDAKAPAPADSINPAVVEAMAEIGVDLAREFPKPLTDDVVRAADVVVTMGCGDACPIYPGKRYVDWELADPAGKGLDQVRAIRDEIDGRVRALLAELVRARVR